MPVTGKDAWYDSCRALRLILFVILRGPGFLAPNGKSSGFRFRSRYNGFQFVGGESSLG